MQGVHFKKYPTLLSQNLKDLNQISILHPIFYSFSIVLYFVSHLYIKNVNLILRHFYTECRYLTEVLFFTLLQNISTAKI